MSFASSRPDHLFHETKYATVSTFDTNTSQRAPEPSNRVQWGINWKAPVKIGGFLIAGAGVAAGHHFFYRHLDGKEVSTDDSRWNLTSQQWKLRYGNGFAFLVKTCLAASISVAYQQHIWTTMRRKFIAVSGLNATFSATNDLSSFLSTSFLSNFKIGVVLAALTW